MFLFWYDFLYFCFLTFGSISGDKVAALAEVGYLPDIEMLAESKVPWAYYMAWSKEFCIGEEYNSVECLKKMYESDYAVVM